MTAEVINLRRARKQKAREQKAADANARRLQFGLTKAEKALRAAESEISRKALDGHKIASQSDES